MSASVTDLKRARTDSQKAARRRAILTAAEHHFAEVGFEGFSMARVGRRAGVAKGTLYLYFRTREELLLALFLDKLEAWARRLLEAVGEESSDERFARDFYRTARADVALLPLMSRLDSVIEHNVSIEVLIDAKRTMASRLDCLAVELAEPLKLTPAEGFEMISALGTLLMGAVQADFGPELNECELPADVRRLTAAFASEPLFTTNACRILSSIRAGR